MHGHVADKHALVFYSINLRCKFCAGNVNYLTINLLQFFRARRGTRLLKSVKNADTAMAYGLDWGQITIPNHYNIDLPSYRAGGNRSLRDENWIPAYAGMTARLLIYCYRNRITFYATEVDGAAEEPRGNCEPVWRVRFLIFSTRTFQCKKLNSKQSVD